MNGDFAKSRKETPMTILEQLWRGNLSPCNRTVKPGSRFETLSHEADRYEDILRTELSEEGIKTYDAYSQCITELYDIAECDDFICGFRLGMLIMMQVIGESHTQLPQL